MIGHRLSLLSVALTLALTMQSVGLASEGTKTLNPAIESERSDSVFSLNFESSQTNWTYTYLKAKPGLEAKLKEFIIKNWFKMDETAIDQGLFRDFQIIDNLAEPNEDTSTAWDLIVAVEYYGDESYSDIQAGFEAIRSSHETQLIDGKGFRDLGSIVRSERIKKQDIRGAGRKCVGKHFAVLAPYLGVWDEYFEGSETDKSGGVLEISVDPFRCNLEKHFILHGRDFSYSTLGYFDIASGVWREIYQFSNGRNSLYEWREEGDDVFLYDISDPNSKNPSNLRRNQWTDVVNGEFAIIAQGSEDGGVTWATLSTTRIVKR